MKGHNTRALGDDSFTLPWGNFCETGHQEAQQSTSQSTHCKVEISYPRQIFNCIPNDYSNIKIVCTSYHHAQIWRHIYLEIHSHSVLEANSTGNKEETRVRVQISSQKTLLRATDTSMYTKRTCAVNIELGQTKRQHPMHA